MHKMFSKPLDYYQNRWSIETNQTKFQQPCKEQWPRETSEYSAF